ncbi:MAG TPA: hypothetical protein VMG10_02230, partial [Gemmataceae bacterium]|nr:hypothetical protein [Gemmataceae bacterium]
FFGLRRFSAAFFSVFNKNKQNKAAEKRRTPKKESWTGAMRFHAADVAEKNRRTGINAPPSHIDCSSRAAGSVPARNTSARIYLEKTSCKV